MDPIKKDGETVMKDVENLLNIYKKSFKETMPGNPYFEGYRAALESISQDIKKIPTEI